MFNNTNSLHRAFLDIFFGEYKMSRKWSWHWERVTPSVLKPITGSFPKRRSRTFTLDCSHVFIYKPKLYAQYDGWFLGLFGQYQPVCRFPRGKCNSYHNMSAVVFIPPTSFEESLFASFASSGYDVSAGKNTKLLFCLGNASFYGQRR